MLSSTAAWRMLRRVTPAPSHPIFTAASLQRNRSSASCIQVQRFCVASSRLPCRVVANAGSAFAATICITKPADAHAPLTHGRRLLHTTAATSPATGDAKAQVPPQRATSIGAPQARSEATPTPPAPQDASAASTAAAEQGESSGVPQAVGAVASPSSSDAPEAQEAPEPTKEERGWRRMWRSFKSEGKDFSLFYFPFYPATFVLLYAAFATGALHKEAMLDSVLYYMRDYVDRDSLYARIEAWNTWANLGFAFVINELLEVVRFPLVVVLYYATKPYSTRFANWLRKWMPRFRRSKVKTEASAKK